MITAIRYTLAPGSGATLQLLFTVLRQGGMSERKAFRKVTWLIEHDKTIQPPIPPGAKPRSPNGGDLELVLPDGVSIPAITYLIPRVFVPTLPPDDLDRALAALIIRLKKDQATNTMVSVDSYRKVWKTVYKTKSRDFRVIWRDALEAPGVKPVIGRPPKSK